MKFAAPADNHTAAAAYPSPADSHHSFTTTTTTAPSPASVLNSAVCNNIPQTVADSETWAYEGVVLPGGQIMVGRWWSPGETRFDPLNVPNGHELSWHDRLVTGPWIFWCVDRD